MKAVQIGKYGHNDVLEIHNIQKPSLAPGKLLIKVHAASVNPIDWKIREGYLKKTSPLQFPVTLGLDFSGVVEEVGEGVTSFKKGDEVYGQAGSMRGGTGAFAEYLLADPKSIALKPKNMNYLKTAALPLVGVSALQGLFEHIKLSKNQKILIHGGAGGIGSIAIQLAKYCGAYVATTVSSKDLDFVKNLGADKIIDFTKEPFESQLHDYDAVFDTVGGETYKKSFIVLKKGGVIVSMLEQPDAQLMKKFGVKSITEFTTVDTKHLKELAALIEKGAIQINIDKVFKLDETTDAMMFQEQKHPRGKVVIDIEARA